MAEEAECNKLEVSLIPEDEEKQEKEPSYILIQFADVGSVVMALKFENVSPEQAMAAAMVLEVKAKNEFVRKENAIQERLSVAKPGILKLGEQK